MNLLSISDIQQIIHESLQGEGIIPYEHGPTPNYYRFIYYLAKAANPDLIVELGSLHGGSALHFAMGAPHAKVISIDWGSLPKPSAPNLEFWEEDTRLVSQRVADIGLPIDILFIDSTHEAKHALEEFRLYYPLMRQGSILLADDIYMADMPVFWEAVPEPKMANNDLNSPTCGFGIHVRQ